MRTLWTRPLRPAEGWVRHGRYADVMAPTIETRGGWGPSWRGWGRYGTDPRRPRRVGSVMAGMRTLWTRPLRPAEGWVRHGRYADVMDPTLETRGRLGPSWPVCGRWTAPDRPGLPRTARDRPGPPAGPRSPRPPTPLRVCLRGPLRPRPTPGLPRSRPRSRDPA